MSELKDKLKHKLKQMSISRKTEYANNLRFEKLEEIKKQTKKKGKKNKSKIKNINKELDMLNKVFETEQKNNSEF